MGVDATQSEGAAALRALGLSYAEVGKRVGASKQSVARWANGEKTPGPDARAALYALGIHPTAWGRRVASAAPDVPVSPPGVVTKAATLATTLEEVDTSIEHIDAKLASDGGEMLPSEWARLYALRINALATRAKIEKDAQMFEAEVVAKAPWWKTVRTAIVEALRTHPAAARDVAEALHRLGA